MLRGGKKKDAYTPVNNTGVLFDDVKGCDEAKEEMKEIVMYLRDPARFTRLGARLPRGVLMTGSPGTGKTLMARAVAGEAKASFFQSSGSEFEEEFVGVGARRVRDLFESARKHTPCIVFIDELDAVGGKRSSREMSHHRQTLNQILVEVDGFKQNEGLVLIAATNFPESLDKALTRAGRLDKKVVLPLPDLRGRQDILQLYAKNITLDCDVDLSVLAQRTTGMTGADLSNILNIAAISASMDQMPAVSQRYLEEAFDRVVVGAARRSPMSQREKNTTAYHEGGHALVCIKTDGSDPLHKATIMPRGSALGVTWSVPENEKFSHRRFELQAKLDMMMGGRAAEELVFGAENVSAGCSSDLQKATDLARQMVMNFGMGSPGGAEPLSMYFDLHDYQVLSDQAKHDLDNRSHVLLRNAYTRALELLRQHQDELHRLAEALMEYETLDAEEIKLAINGKKGDIQARHRVNNTFRCINLSHTLAGDNQEAQGGKTRSGPSLPPKKKVDSAPGAPQKSTQKLPKDLIASLVSDKLATLMQNSSIGSMSARIISNGTGIADALSGRGAKVISIDSGDKIPAELAQILQQAGESLKADVMSNLSASFEIEEVSGDDDASEDSSQDEILGLLSSIGQHDAPSQNTSHSVASPQLLLLDVEPHADCSVYLLIGVCLVTVSIFAMFGIKRKLLFFQRPAEILQEPLIRV
eukprot:gnl/TRDRNA2_/TRDRNA2_165042_c0_seq1.p1 gnl/TRDRNA2_/TRDRNA2_165042_c0~~gnl/TRDRNA2_/TRDRNA2_165042_c0_seq1.p1  ORF type:complete len:804 (+),score=129.48 gnl/TRDRNA2_/TRDRNA2_165042_c0_seq1:316-2412(+)